MEATTALDGGLFGGENRRWWTLGAVSLGLFMIMLDNTVVNVALPSIQQSLGLSLSELEWVVAGYALTFAALMLTGGKLADLLGRRRIFVAGLVVFTLASLACGLAGSAEVLIGARVVQGIGAAMMNPATLSIITATFPPKQRGTAIGIWAGVSALALAIGPLVGGLLSEHVDWSWIFFVNVPVGIIAIAAAYAFIDESRDTSRDQRPDVPGLVSSGIGLFALTYALIEANTHGWGSTRILGAFAIAAVSLAAFVVLELRQRRPMLDLTLFRNATFSGANVAMLLVALAMFGVFFYVSLYVQQILGYSPVEAGASFLPATILIAVLAPQIGRMVDRERDAPSGRVARALLPARDGLDLLGHPPRPRRDGRRHGVDDDADDGRGDGLGAARPGGRRISGAEQHAPGRRLARDRGHRRDRRARHVDVARRRRNAAGRVRPRLPAGARGRGSDRAGRRRRRGRDDARAPRAAARAGPG